MCTLSGCNGSVMPWRLGGLIEGYPHFMRGFAIELVVTSRDVLNSEGVPVSEMKIMGHFISDKT